ncbi:hypothetical protein HYH03_000078 [Edaphochlamys debaryana]|uniref:Methylenetetrahydrofolate reductase (NAD(P)H) n=1 Tax=Edaphochlamys debaryana TaxID=47281 RepID=A0A835YF65_9CHLO|nr:hypothetical protein HYH03_000078 [Edaphochlamys debaryana]|eukprot:KAG2501573.1 hypothetical protein HYH03_000078 [Edaphochlamys debaryana]
MLGPASPQAAARFLPLAARALSTSAATAAAASSSTASSSSGRTPGWTLTLERGMGKEYGKEAELQSSGAFAAEVFPDLPIATTWQNLIKALSGSLRASATADPAPPFTHFTTRPGAAKVVTVAANLRSEADIEARIRSACAGPDAAAQGPEGAQGPQRARALLCVSGSHPVRSLPLVPSLFRSSLDTLRIATRLRAAGAIPPDTQLWAVANPNTERGAGLLERKVELGAQVVLTQPPLDWEAYLAWLGDAERRGLLLPALPSSSAPSPSAPASEAAGADPSSPAASGAAGTPSPTDAGARLLVGHPMASSAGNLSFWLALSGCGGSAAARELVAAAAVAEAGGKEAAAAHLAAFNRRLVEQILARGGVAGLHVMPITRAAKQAALRMLADGSLPRSEP